MQVDEYSKVTTSEGDSYTVAKALPSQSALEYATDDSNTIVGHFRDPNRYISFAVSGWIDTLIPPTATQEIYIKFKRTATSGYNHLYGSRTANGLPTSNARNFISRLSDTSSRRDFGATATSMPVLPVNVVHNIVDKAESFTVNGVEEIGTVSGTVSSTLPILVGNANSNGFIDTSQGFQGNIYSFKIIDSGAVLIDLYPVFSGEVIDGKIAPSDCFYDFVSKSFFENSGAGALTFGRDGWIKFSGNNWINVSDGDSVRTLRLSGRTLQTGSNAPSPTNIRRIAAARRAYYEFTGAEPWIINGNRFQWNFGGALPSGITQGADAMLLSSHFMHGDGNLSPNTNIITMLSSSGVYNYPASYFAIYRSSFPDVTSFKTFLAAQAAAGTPVQASWIISAAYTGNITTFDNLLVQPGAGTPSPDNIRPMTPALQNLDLYGQGGSYDYITDKGILVRKFAVYEFTGAETFAAYNSSSSNAWFRPSQSAKNTPDGVTGNIICSHYQTSPYLDNGGGVQNPPSIGISANGLIVLRDTRFTTEASFKAYLADQFTTGTPVQVVYEIATPTIEYLTPPDPKKPWDCLGVRGFSDGSLIGGRDLVGWKT